MIINGTAIRTPHDPGIGVEFDPDWRRKVAVAWLDSDRYFPPRVINDDDVIRKYVSYLKLIKRTGGNKIPPRFKDIADAEAWYAGGERSVKNILDCLLLSGVELKFAAMDLVPMLSASKLNGADYDRVMRVINLYEKLFFNIRNDDGTVNQSIYTRTYFALEGIEPDDRMTSAQELRFISAIFGYTALVYFCHNLKHAHGELLDDRHLMELMMREAQVLVLARVVKKGVNNFDMSMIIGKAIEHEKMRYDTKADSSSKSKDQELVRSMIGLTAPVLIAAGQSEIERLRTDKLYHNDYQARKNIAAQTVKDSGVEAGVKEWGKVKDSNVSGQGFKK